MAHHRRPGTVRTSTGRPRPVLTRRTLLADLGRITLGAVVLGTGVAACDDGGSSGAPAATPAGRASDPAGMSDPAGTSDPAGMSDPTGTGALSWERASFGFVSAYVLVRAGEVLVFDTGTSDGGIEPIVDALAAAGAGWGDVAHVLVSHDHGDHVGGIEAVMAEATMATAHAAGPDFASVQRRVDRAEEVADGDDLLGLRVVATPGHTRGHVSAFDPGAGLLLTGDALVNGVQIGGSSGEGIEVSPPDFTADAAAATASVGVLADLGPSTMLFGHGDPLTDGAADELSTYADSL